MGAATAPTRCASKRASFHSGRANLDLGDLAGARFYIDAEQYERWGRPSFLIDVSDGAAEGFSLEGLAGVHFVTLTPRL